MSQESTAPPYPAARPGCGSLIGVILAPAVVIPLWVPLYDKADPSLWGFPFFYWFQFAMILMSAVLTVIAYAISQVAERAPPG